MQLAYPTCAFVFMWSLRLGCLVGEIETRSARSASGVRQECEESEECVLKAV